MPKSPRSSGGLARWGSGAVAPPGAPKNQGRQNDRGAKTVNRKKIPFTSCIAKRTFSVLKRVKTRLRSTMEQERLEALMLMAIEADIVGKLDVEKNIDLFGSTSVELSRKLIK